ncbi:hypothetical protein RZS08_63940, partial [Arthrospira platensis SPKY1]|nr:hypothetical protein [Arthrospira platensis SPKY1]
RRAGARRRSRPPRQDARDGRGVARGPGAEPRRHDRRRRAALRRTGPCRLSDPPGGEPHPGGIVRRGDRVGTSRRGDSGRPAGVSRAARTGGPDPGGLRPRLAGDGPVA